MSSLLFISALQLRAQTIVWVMDGHPDGLQVNSVAFSPNGAYILSGTNCHPAKIRLYNSSDGSLNWDYTVSTSLECMMGVGMSANNQFLASAEETGNLMLFDYTQNPPVLVKTIDLATSYAFAVDFAPNSGKVAVGTSAGKLKTFNLPDGTADLNISAHPSNAWVTTLRYSPDNTMIASGGSDNKVKIWDTSGVLLKTLNGHTGDITSVKFTPDNQRLISASQDHSIKIWDVQTGALAHTIATGSVGVNTVDISPDGQYLVAATADDLVKIWRLNDYSELVSFTLAPYGSAMSVAWSPVANQIVCGTTNSKVVLYDVNSLVSAVTDVLENQISVYPNPFADQLQFTIQASDLQSVTLFDPAGRSIYSNLKVPGQNTYRIAVDKQLPDGIYMIQIRTDDDHFIIKQVLRHRR